MTPDHNAGGVTAGTGGVDVVGIKLGDRTFAKLHCNNAEAMQHWLNAECSEFRQVWLMPQSTATWSLVKTFVLDIKRFLVAFKPQEQWSDNPDETSPAIILPVTDSVLIGVMNSWKDDFKGHFTFLLLQEHEKWRLNHWHYINNEGLTFPTVESSELETLNDPFYKQVRLDVLKNDRATLLAIVLIPVPEQQPRIDRDDFSRNEQAALFKKHFSNRLIESFPYLDHFTELEKKSPLGVEQSHQNDYVPVFGPSSWDSISTSVSRLLKATLPHITLDNTELCVLRKAMCVLMDMACMCTCDYRVIHFGGNDTLSPSQVMNFANDEEGIGDGPWGWTVFLQVFDMYGSDLGGLSSNGVVIAVKDNSEVVHYRRNGYTISVDSTVRLHDFGGRHAHMRDIPLIRHFQ